MPFSYLTQLGSSLTHPDPPTHPGGTPVTGVEQKLDGHRPPHGQFGLASILCQLCEAETCTGGRDTLCSKLRPHCTWRGVEKYVGTRSTVNSFGQHMYCNYCSYSYYDGISST